MNKGDMRFRERATSRSIFSVISFTGEGRMNGYDNILGDWRRGVKQGGEQWLIELALDFRKGLHRPGWFDATNMK